MITVLFTPCHSSALVLGKPLWMRMNRALAWALVVSPVVQIVLRTDLANGLYLDLAILIAHSALSIALFGLPKNKDPRKTAWTRWVGLPELGMSPRNQFLLSGWRIVLSSLWLSALPCAIFAWAWLSTAAPPLHGWSVGVGTLALPLLFCLATFFWLQLQYSLLTHLSRATEYALRRWGCAQSATPLVARVVVAVFVYSSIVNLFRPLWR